MCFISDFDLAFIQADVDWGIDELGYIHSYRNAYFNKGVAFDKYSAGDLVGALIVPHPLTASPYRILKSNVQQLMVDNTTGLSFKNNIFAQKNTPSVEKNIVINENTNIIQAIQNKVENVLNNHKQLMSNNIFSTEEIEIIKNVINDYTEHSTSFNTTEQQISQYNNFENIIETKINELVINNITRQEFEQSIEQVFNHAAINNIDIKNYFKKHIDNRITQVMQNYNKSVPKYINKKLKNFLRS